MNVQNIMTGIAAQLRTVPGLRVFPYPPDTITPPCAVVAYPDTITYDESMRDASNRITLPVHVVVGKVIDRTTARNTNSYLSTNGSSSIKTVIEEDESLSGAAMSVRVTEASTSVMTIAGTDYLAATFILDIVA